MTCHMTWPATPAVQQLLQHLRLILELCPPVLKALQKQPMRLAILALVQLAALPRLMMRSPERLTLLGRALDRPVALSTSLSAAYVAVEDRLRSRGPRQVCEKWTLTCSSNSNSLILPKNSLFSRNKFPVLLRPNLWAKAAKVHSRGLFPPDTR